MAKQRIQKPSQRNDLWVTSIFGAGVIIGDMIIMVLVIIYSNQHQDFFPKPIAVIDLIWGNLALFGIAVIVTLVLYVASLVQYSREMSSYHVQIGEIESGSSD